MTRQTEEEVGRQYQGMDRPGVRQVPEGSGEKGKMEKTGCKIICGDPTTLVVKGLMTMMMRENFMKRYVVERTNKAEQDQTNRVRKWRVCRETLMLVSVLSWR